MSDFKEAHNNDKLFKQNLISEFISTEKQNDYNKAVEYSIDDLMEVIEAVKDKSGIFDTDQKIEDQLKIFLEEHTVRLLNIIKK
ncbi:MULTISPECIES: hypothetical protein [unclassified Paenibacillus]|uniref:hypothetical protein n=1 Tax=unclassified Paenibacillus TaxID=185978 RepID=UPI000FE21D15|nr:MULTISPECIES: hypothetical protein [unclassified Paenibacillus]MCM3171928.1 hypothetical protein [Paenibacillus sp. MER 99-2]